MQAWTQSILWVSALTVLFLVHSTAAAPLTDQTTEIEYYPVADSTGCYYNFQHYDEGDRIITNEPCLNCTCHNRMLMCYLRVCPFTKAIGQDCTVEKRPDQCCPVITCPEVPVQLLTSTTTESSKSTDVGHPDTYGCSIDNLFYSDGARVPSHPNKPCELCYCIRNRTACVMQECTLKIEGCKPVYQEGVCCPVKYDCEYPEDSLLETTVKPTPAVVFTTTTLAPGAVDCVYNNEIYADGALVKKDIPCEHCYCMKGDIVCAVQECGPTPLDKVNCTALPTSEGQCCPDTYDCENAVGEISTEGYEYSTTPVVHPIVSEEEASSAEPSPAVTSQPALDEVATTPSATREEEIQTSSQLPEVEEPIASATTQQPIRETQPKKEDEGYVYPKPAIPGLEITPLAETTTLEEVNEFTTALPAEINKQKVPSDEQITEKTPSGEIEKAEEPTSPSPSLEDREKERPVEVQTVETPLAETRYTPKEDTSSHVTTAQAKEQTTLASATEAAEEEVTAGTALPTIQPGELPEEGKATTAQKLPELTTARPILEETATQVVSEEFSTIREKAEVTTEIPSEEKTELPEKETEIPVKVTALPEEVATTVQPLKESVTTSSSEQSPQPEVTKAEAVEASTAKADEITETAFAEAVTPQEPVQTTQKPTIVEQTTLKEEISKETELPHAATTVPGEHVTEEPEIVSEIYEPSHDQIPAEEHEEEEEEEGSGAQTEKPVEEGESATTEAPALVTDRTGSVATAEVEQEGAHTSPVTESSAKGASASSVSTEEVVTEITTAEPAKSEIATEELPVKPSEEIQTTSAPAKSDVATEEVPVKPSEEIHTTQQPTVVESETQEAQETKRPSELIPEGVTSSPVTELPSTGVTAQEHFTEANLIPGEGSCLVLGQTYSNNSSVPPINKCQVSCKCVSSIVHCESISCTPPPSNADNCTPVFEGPHACCPTYSCTPQSSTEIESDSHKMQEASTTFEELTTALPSEKYTTEEPKETSVEISEEETTARATEKPEYPQPGPEATTLSHVSEEIQTTEKSALPETTARQEEPETGAQTTETASEAIETNEIPTAGAKQPEISQEAATTALPEKSSSTEAVTEKLPSTEAAEGETESGVTTAKVVEGAEEKIETTVRPPSVSTEISSEEPETPTGTEKIERVTELPLTTVKHAEGSAETVTSSIVEKGTEAAVEVTTERRSSESESTSLPEREGVSPGIQAGTIPSESVPCKEAECAAPGAVAEEAAKPVTEGIVEHVTEVIPPKEMGKPESHVTESARKPTSEIAASEPVTTEVPLSSSRIPQQEHIPVSSEKPQEAATSATIEEITPGLIAHDIESAEEEEEVPSATEKPATTEAAPSTESIKEISSAETPKETAPVEAATEVPASETPKEATTEAAAVPTESVEKISPTQPSLIPASSEASSTEPSKEVTLPETLSTEAAKETSSTEPPKEPEPVTLEIEKEITTESEKEAAGTTHTVLLETNPPKQAETTESVNEVTRPESTSTELPQEVASPEKPEDVQTEQAPQEVSTEIIAEVTTVISVSEEATTHPEQETEKQTEIQGTTAAPPITEKPADENEIVQDHVINPEQAETEAPETVVSTEQASEPEATEGPKEEIESATSKVSAPYETTLPSVEEVATTLPPLEQEPSVTETPLKEEIPIVTERVSEATTEAVAEISELPAEAATTQKEEEEEKVAAITTAVPSVSEEQTVKEPSELEQIATGKPVESEAPQSQTTSAVSREEETRKPEQATTPSIAPEQPEEGLAAQTTALPAVEEQTVEPQSIPQATTEAEASLVTEPVEVQTEAVSEVETTVPPLSVEVTEAATKKPSEVVTTVAQEEFATSPSSTSLSQEAVTSEAITSKPELATSLEIQTEASKVDVTTPQPEVEATEAITATSSSVSKEPALEPETAETHVPETSEETGAKEIITTVQPPSETTFAEPAGKPEEIPEVSKVTTVSELEAATTAQPSRTEESALEVTTPKEEYSKTTSAVAATSPPEIPGEGLPAQEPTAEKEQVPQLDSVSATTLAYGSSSPYSEGKVNVSIEDRVPAASTPLPSLETSRPSIFTSPASTETPTTSPSSNEVPEIPDYTSSTEEDYPEEEDQGTFGPGTCRYGGKLYMSAQQIPRDDPCDFCFCFRSDIICLQQSCPPPIPHCHEEPIRGFCCPRYECPVSMATTLNLTTTSTTTTTTLPPHFLAHAYSGRATRQGCQIQGQAYQVGEVIKSASGPCLHCTCGGDGQMKCDPKACSPEPMLRQMIAAAASRRRR